MPKCFFISSYAYGEDNLQLLANIRKVSDEMARRKSEKAQRKLLGVRKMSKEEADRRKAFGREQQKYESRMVKNQVERVMDEALICDQIDIELIRLKKIKGAVCITKIEEYVAKVLQKVEESINNAINRGEKSWSGTHQCSHNDLCSKFWMARKMQDKLRSRGFVNCQVQAIGDRDESSSEEADEITIKRSKFKFSGIVWDEDAAQAAEVKEVGTGLRGRCPISYEEENLRVLTPCGHAVGADICKNFVGKACPLCKASVTGSNAVYLS